MKCRRDLFGIPLEHNVSTTSFSYFAVYSCDLIMEKNCSKDFNQTFRTVRGGLHLGVQGGIVISWTNLFLTHSHTMMPFDSPWETSLWKTLWENDKLLVTRNFSFSHSIFYFLPFSSNLKLSSVNSFSLEESKICRLVMG